MKLPASNQQYRLFLKDLRKFDKKKSYSLLEIGAGDRIIEKFLPSNFTYKSLDFGKQHDYNFNLDDGSLPIKDNTFDIIICLETLEHTMYPERIIKEMLRITKKDAFFFLSMPNDYNFVQRFYFLIGKKTMFDGSFQVVEKHLHIHKVRVKDILKLFSKHFKIEKVDYVWESLHSTEYLRFSSLFRALDKLIDVFAQLWPSMFTRLVAIKGRKK